ncbi:hypothetical protein F3J23_14385 [Chryseobacterium sp. Tr-659]|uniref:hypothetical protein n=1 Tax=Chryseobacterium sp. Tr-659 TaxID=2608340 RepID=UPI00141EA559|nr:hypothetical protein [Chryseobacterium sp. Tr-659]NIF06634.1 hypothetical protein [Chryseobacterium sp. Tr-659]
MGSYNTTLVLLKEKQHPKTFLSNFHKKIKDINVVLEKDEYQRIIFNDKRNEEEKEPIELDKLMSDEDIIDLLCSWGGFGLLSYRHNDVEFALYINYLSWDDQFIEGIEVSFKETHKNYINKNKIKDDVIIKIANCIDYKLVVGSIGDSEDNFRMDLDLEYNLKYIENKKFDIDIR